MAMQFKKRNPILSEHSMASTFHSHISLSCLGHAAPLTTLKATYLQTRYTTDFSSVSVAHSRFSSLSDTLTSVLLQDNSFKHNTVLSLEKRKPKPPHLPALRKESELKCYKQHLLLKYGQHPQICSFRTLTHHLTTLYDT